MKFLFSLVKIEDCYNFLHVQQNLLLSPSGVGAFCFKRLLVIDSIFADKAYLDYLSVLKVQYVMYFRELVCFF